MLWEIVHLSVFAQELNRIMAWSQLRRSLLSFFPVNPGKKLRGYPGCRQAMILFRRRGGMGVSNVRTHVARFARLSVSVSELVVVCVVYLKTLPEWLRGHQTAIVW